MRSLGSTADRWPPLSQSARTRFYLCVLLLLCAVAQRVLQISKAVMKTARAASSAIRNRRELLHKVARHALGLTPKEFEVSLSMKHMMYDPVIIRCSLVLMVASIMRASVHVCEVYITYMQMWNVHIILNVVGESLINRTVSHFLSNFTLNMHNVMYKKMMDSYSMVSHTTETISMYEYIVSLEKCIYPILDFPGNILSMAVRLVHCIWITGYLIYLMEINVYHLLFCSCCVAVLHRLLRERIRIDERWDRYIEESNQLFSIRNCLTKMVQSSEVRCKTRTAWGEAQHIYWNSIYRSEEMNSTCLAMFVITFLTGMYVCTKGLNAIVYRNTAEGNALTLALMYAALPQVCQMIGLIAELFSPKTHNDQQSKIFPRIHSVVMKNGGRTISSTPMTYPIHLEFPFHVPNVDVTVDLVGLRLGSVQVTDPRRFDISLGDRVLIWGSSGCGKSTLVQFLCRMRHLPEDGVTYDGQFQWIGEGVAAGFDFTYMKVERLFSLECRTSDGDNRVPLRCPDLTDVQRSLIDLFQLTDVHARCSTAENTNGVIEESDHSDEFLRNVSAGEKNRLHSMACIWKAINDPTISTVVWDEGEQGLSADMFVSIVRGVDKLLHGKTLICISHCQEARTLPIWSTMAELG